MAIQSTVRKVMGNREHEEGRFTEVLERQTARVPSVTYLNLSLLSMAASLGIAARSRNPGWANFVGLWAPAFMLMGIYNKLVKQHGSD